MRTVTKALVAKKTLFAIILALTIFGAVYGFAGTPNGGTNQLSAGNATAASCQSTTPATSYTVGYDATLGAYKVATVTVTGFDGPCATKNASVTLTGTGGSNLITLSGSVPTVGTPLVLTPGTTISAAAVTGLSVAVNG